MYRPKPGETEEDLLRLQEEFERNKTKNKIKPSTTFVSEKSKQQRVIAKDVEISKEEIEEQLANTFEAIPRDMKLQNIMERRPLSLKIQPSGFHAVKGFPQAKRRDPSISPGKGSIFAQQIKKLRKEETAMEVDTSPINENTLTIKEKCVIATKVPIVKDIHEENLNIIRNLTEEEIKEEREKLIDIMDPAIVTFLKSRRKKETMENRKSNYKRTK
ncbi:hypothetical protein NQ317_000703 [Molorchus minor]|uniref:RPAP1 N-terminal domain-containing protein n=1 Tax=Molorchus minor TaxID=1323400 RepID=A0ABQ9JBC9_9CUCU|nr:hypothetical protein NQ317_000703 [Molorchus minor]